MANLEFTLNSFLLVLFVFPSTCFTLQTLPEAACITHIRQGDVNLGGIFSFHFSWGALCGSDLNDFAVQLAEMMIFEIERINARDDLLPNVTIGYVIRDDCGSEDIALWSALSFINDEGVGLGESSRKLSCPNVDDHANIPVVGIIGTPFSFTTLLVARVGSLYSLPVVSYWATTDELSEKSRFPFFLRTVPPDEFQAGAMIDLLIRFNWKYVILLYSVDGYGVHGARQLRTLAEHNDICIALTLAVQPYAHESELTEIVQKFSQVPKAKAILAFSRSDQVYAVLAVMKKLDLRLNLTWIGSDAWGYELMENGLGYLAQGAFLIRVDQNVVPVFKEHFDRLNLDQDEINPWLKQYWMDWRNSRNCSNIKDCPIPVEPYGAALFNAIDAYAHVLHSIQEKRCNGSTSCNIDWSDIDGETILAGLNEGSFQGIDGQFEFDEDGNVAGKYNLVNLQSLETGYKLVQIGTWDSRSKEKLDLDLNKIIFADGTQIPPASLCRENCKPGFIVVPLEKKCCFGCKKCPANAIVVDNECAPCDITHWPDKEFMRCEPIVPDTLKWNDPLIVTLLASTFAGLSLSFLTTIGLIVYRDHPLIKATSRELSAVNIAGITLAFFASFPLLVQPTHVSCPSAEALISICFTLIYTPTLLKVIRIYRIFKAGKKSVKRPRFVGSKAQLLLSAVASGCQVAIVIFSTAMSPSRQEFIYTSPPSQHIEVYCKFGNGFIASCAYNFIIICICCFVAFKARKVPSNYNESKFIAVSVYSTLLVCLAAAPVYTTAIKAKQKVATLCMALLVNAFLTLVCVYLPKLYAIRFVDADLNVQEWRSSITGGSMLSTAQTASSTIHSTRVHPISPSPNAVNSNGPGMSSVN